MPYGPDVWELRALGSEAVGGTVACVSLAAGCPRHGVQVERAVPYGHGKVLDIYRPWGADAAAGTQPVVLLWHGVGPDERGVLEPLARATAALGLTVVVPGLPKAG